jgi:hypothetical protein
MSIASALSIALVLLQAHPMPPPHIVARGVDFLFMAGVDDVEKVSFEVPFPVGNSCKTLYWESHGAVAIESVLADGVAIKPRQNMGSYVDGTLDVAIESPGPGFQYRLPLFDLSSQEPTQPEYSSVEFPISPKSPPNTVEIRYRIRCADGKLGPPLVTRGRNILPTLRAARSRAK